MILLGFDASAFKGKKRLIIAFNGNEVFSSNNRLAHRMVIVLGIVLLVVLGVYVVVYLFVNPQRKIVEMSKYVKLMTRDDD